MFKIKVANEYICIPPEFTLVDGVPDKVRSSPGMRDALKQTRVSPEDKMKKIEDMCKVLISQDSFEKWGFKIDQVPISIQNTVLGAPQIFNRGQVIHCSEDSLRKQSINKAVHLTHNDWVMFYQNPEGKGRSNYNAADTVLKTFK